MADDSLINTTIDSVSPLVDFSTWRLIMLVNDKHISSSHGPALYRAATV